MKTRSGYRKIVVNNVNWQYKVTHLNVVAYSEFGDKLLAKFDDIAKTIEGQECECCGQWVERVTTITPKVISDWINISI